MKYQRRTPLHAACSDLGEVERAHCSKEFVCGPLIRRSRGELVIVTEGDRTLWQVTKSDCTVRHRSDLVKRGQPTEYLFYKRNKKVDPFYM